MFSGKRIPDHFTQTPSNEGRAQARRLQGVRIMLAAAEFAKSNVGFHCRTKFTAGFQSKLQARQAKQDR